MPKKVHIFHWSLAAFLCLMGLFLMEVISAYYFSGLCCFALAALVLCIYGLKLLKLRKPGLARGLKIALTVFLCVFVVAACVTGGFIIHAAVTVPEPGYEYLIVLGCGVDGTVPSMSLRERINGAYAYLSANPDTVCIASGGQGPREDITEAYCIFRELTAMGIEPERIWMESRSTSTKENLSWCLELIEEKTGDLPERVGITSSEYHVFRAGLMLRDLGVTSQPVPATTRSFSLRTNYFLREIAATWFYLIFHR